MVSNKNLILNSGIDGNKFMVFWHKNRTHTLPTVLLLLEIFLVNDPENSNLQKISNEMLFNQNESQYELAKIFHLIYFIFTWIWLVLIKKYAGEWTYPVLKKVENTKFYSGLMVFVVANYLLGRVFLSLGYFLLTR